MNDYLNKPLDPECLWSTLLRSIRKNECDETVPSSQPVQGSVQSGPAISSNEAPSGTFDPAIAKNIEGNVSPDGGSMVDADWLQAFADHLGRGDFKAVELWESNITMLNGHFSPEEQAQISRALQQFDFARALEYFTARAGR